MRKTVTLSCPTPHCQVDGKAITLGNVVAEYDDKIVLRNAGFCVDASDRIILLGANGNEKSALAILLSNRLTPLWGNISCARNAKISYFSEHKPDEVNVESSLM
jgi:ATP-binding cassette subfamily F protein 3